MQLPEEERQGIPHHLIDIITPDEDFSAGSFYHLARQATADILQVQEDGARQDATLHSVALELLLHVRPPAWTMGGIFHAQRGRTPIIVGGTGFYLRWFIYGKPMTPVSTETTSAAAQSRLDKVCLCLYMVEETKVPGGTETNDCPMGFSMQIWADAASEQGVTELTPEGKWAAGVQLVGSLGDPTAASRQGAS